MLASAFYAVLRSTGVTAVARRTRNGGAILCYHNVVEPTATEGAPGLHLDVVRFREQMEWIKRHYTVIPLPDFGRRLRAGRSLRNVVAVTCDDGYHGTFDLAWPILRDLGLPATVFVPTGLAFDHGFWWDAPAIVERTTPAERDRWLSELVGDGTKISQIIPRAPGTLPQSHRLASWERIIQAARDGCDLGVHSSTHRNLTLVPDDELQRELEGSRDILVERTGCEARSFSYPYGRFDSRVRAAVKRAGFEIAVTLDFGLNGRFTDHLALRRINVPSGIGPAAFEAWVSGIRPRVGESA
jgi:peptidoglycan/xylan/chitin deacetylase (PgdA/CDA1 family)